MAEDDQDPNGSLPVAVGVVADGQDPNGSFAVAVGEAADGQDPNGSLPVAVGMVTDGQDPKGIGIGIGKFYFVINSYIYIQISDTDKKKPQFGDVTSLARLPYRRFFLFYRRRFGRLDFMVIPMIVVWSSESVGRTTWREFNVLIILHIYHHFVYLGHTGSQGKPREFGKTRQGTWIAY